MNKRIKNCLINPSEEDLLVRDPLMAFSFYLSGRNNILLNTGDEIIELLNEGFTGKSIIKGDKIQQAETLMWFWILGAYEVIRTMCQARQCFSADFYRKISSLKKDLGEVRMPASKMEKQGKQVPVSSNRSPSGWEVEHKDLLVNDPSDKAFSAQALIGGYDLIISSLTVKDVLKKHSESY